QGLLKKKRQWTTCEKLFILTYLEKVPGASIRGMADKFHLEPKQIQDWRNKTTTNAHPTPHKTSSCWSMSPLS
ncbi:2839_t:CDS:1, partial [Ambispora gerdemannii]